MFYDTFKMLCDSKGVSCNKAALEIGLSNSTPTKWKKTGAFPDSKTLTKIADYFQVPFDLLLGKPEDGVSLNQILGVISQEFGITWEEAFEIDQILQRPEWRTKCQGLGLSEAFRCYFEEQRKAPTHQGERQELSPAFFRLKQGLEPYDISDSDVDFLLDVYKAHIKKNSQE